MSAALGKYTTYTRGAFSAALDQDADLVYLRLQRWVDAECRGHRNPTAQVAQLPGVRVSEEMLLVPLIGMQTFDTGHLVARLRTVFGPEADLRLEETNTAGIAATLVVPRRLPAPPAPPARRSWLLVVLVRLLCAEPVTALLVTLIVASLAGLGATRGVEDVALLRLTRDVLAALWHSVARALTGARTL